MNGMCYKASALLPFLNSALSRRVDIGICGDSNTLKDQISGNNCGMRLAFGGRFGMYATGLLTLNHGAEGAETGYASGLNSSPMLGGSNTGSPTTLEALNINNYPPDPATYPGVEPICCSNWMYLPSGDSVAYNANVDIAELFGVVPPSSGNATNNNGSIIKSSLMDLTNTLNFEYTFGTFGAGAGYFNPTAHQFGSATVIYSTQNVATAGTAVGFTDGTLVIPAGARNGSGAYAGGIGISLTDYNNSSSGGVIGPFLMSYSRVQIPSVTAGIAYSTLVYQGGQDARTCAVTWQTLPQAAATELFRQITRLQNGTPMLLVQIMHGGNDINDHSTSVGPNPQVSSTPGGLADNLTAIIDRVTTLWTTAGNSASNLFFLLGPYQPQLSRLATTLVWEGQTMQELVAYEQAMMSVANTFANTAVIQGSQLLPGGFQQSATYMQAKGYYDYQGDAHLVRQGYDYLGQRAVDALISEAGLTSQTYPLIYYVTGQAVTLKAYDSNSGTLAQAIALTETPPGTGRYTSSTPVVVFAQMDIQYIANGNLIIGQQTL
ncbi:MAG: hypothetical protein ACP5I8_16005 [Phycisphaerae bacterium]